VLSGMQLTENNDYNSYSSIHGSSSSGSSIGGDSSSSGGNIYSSSGGGELNSAHHVGFNLRNLPVALGLICFCFGGHGTL